eukprot:TRINITY_DN7005_c0_g2_i1.p1 TRINITY_DN7005_c0_g2~~TRINITY_DN7005_c0_g2_i1.p1  ORF type:complete len:550 (+),score=147.36 TRINITY_DN7005_c0_g2_i1:84-1652(+)
MSEEVKGRAKHGASVPPGFFVDERGRVREPAVKIRKTRSMFGGPATYDLVVVTGVQEGETLCTEVPALSWDPSMRCLKPPLPADEPEQTLAQRCILIRKMMDKAPRLSPHCEGTLPLMYAYAMASYRHRKGMDGTNPQNALSIPFTAGEGGGTHGGFCVLALRGLQESPFSDAFRSHEELHRLSGVCSEGGLSVPDGMKAVFPLSSCARKLQPAKDGVSGRGPNCDYDIDGEGRLVLRAAKRLVIGDVVSVPLEKEFEERRPREAMDVLRDKDTMREALMAKAAKADAPEAVRSYGLTEHPRIPPRLPPPGTLDIPARNVSSETWREVLVGDPCGGRDSSPFALYVDYLLDTAECGNLLGALARVGKEISAPFHIGFEEHAHRVDGEDFGKVARLVFQRGGAMLPPKLRGAPLTGAGAAGTLLRLGMGEELLRFTFDAVRCEVDGPQAAAEVQMLPFCLCLNSTGRVNLYPPSKGGIPAEPVQVPAKPGRLIMWSPDIAHEVPMSDSGEAALLFADLAYGQK